MAKHKLPDLAKAMIIRSLARFETPAAVADGVKAEFGIEVTRQSVEAYDPTKVAGRSLARRWRLLFDETQAAFIRDFVDIGIAHRTVRLRRIQHLLDKAAERGNDRLAMKLLEQAAREMANMFADRQRASMPSSAVEIRRS